MTFVINDLTGNAMKLVAEERQRQFQKWGDQSRLSILEWVAILGEEFGEVSKEAVEHHFQNRSLLSFKKEVVQMTAVGVQMLEAIELNEQRERIRQKEEFAEYAEWFQDVLFEAVRAGVPRSEIVSADVLFRFLYDQKFAASSAFLAFESATQKKAQNEGWKAISETLDEMKFAEELEDQGEPGHYENIEEPDFDTWFENLKYHVRSIGYEGFLDQERFESYWIEGRDPEETAKFFVKTITE